MFFNKLFSRHHEICDKDVTPLNQQGLSDAKKILGNLVISADDNYHTGVPFNFRANKLRMIKGNLVLYPKVSFRCNNLEMVGQKIFAYDVDFLDMPNLKQAICVYADNIKSINLPNLQNSTIYLPMNFVPEQLNYHPSTVIKYEKSPLLTREKIDKALESYANSRRISRGR